MVFALMFFILPLATIPGLFDFIFVVLGGFTIAILGLIIASLVADRKSSSELSEK